MSSRDDKGSRRGLKQDARVSIRYHAPSLARVVGGVLKIYNSLTRRKEIFEPIEPGKVRMYVCGMTVYDYCHIGHARVLVAFDVVLRYLRSLDYAVTYVRNITDVDDKIIRRANENREDYDALTQRFTKAMHEDEGKLGVLRPDVEPRATGTIAEMLEMIGILIDKGYAYVGANRDVYYDVSKFATYGKLSDKRIEDVRAGARVEVDESKDDPLDFVLWKAAKPGEPHWISPWGEGRPGWHIECSAMSKRCLGQHFDIHGGGMDLMFPHHENEIAQSEAASGGQFVNVWMHNGFVRVDEEKMSKSLGNFFTVREVLKSYLPEVVRFFIVASHYRSPLNYSDTNLDGARASLARLYTALRGLGASDGRLPETDDYVERFRAAMDDDFNTPGALAVLFELARETNRARDRGAGDGASLAARLRSLGGVLGILQDDPESFLQAAGAEPDAFLDRAEIESMIEARNEARAARSWKEADRIRDELKASGILLEDGPEGTTWRRGA